MDKINIDRTVLYLDDEAENLDGFNYSFRKDYTIYLASTVEEAFEVLESVEIKVVISDQRMPQITGTEFLSQVARKYPDTIRIILTAFTDTEAIIEAVNKSSVFRFLTKPWNLNDLRLTIENGIANYDLRAENQLLIDNLRIINDDLSHTNLQLKNEIEIRKNTEEELENHRNHLEEIVKERTDEIQEINQELISSNDDLNSANQQLEDYKRHLEELVDERTEELLESEKRLKTLSDSLPGGVIFRMKVTKQNTLDLLYASAQFEQIIGLPLDMCMQDLSVIKSLIPTSQLEEIVEDLVAAVKQFRMFQSEFRIENKDQKKWIQIKAKPARLSSNEILWDGFAIDITQRKNSEIQLSLKNQELVVAEEELRSINEELRAVNDDLADKNNQLETAFDKLKQSEEKYKELFDKMINGFAICEAIYDKQNILADFKFIQLNPAFEVHSGFSTEYCLGKKASEVSLQFDNFWLNKCNNVLRTGISETFEQYVKAFDRILYVTIYKPAEGHFALMFEDITQRKEIETALRDNEEKYRLIVEGQTDLIIKLDASFNVLFASPSFCQNFQITENEIVGEHYPSFVNKQNQQDILNCFDKLSHAPYTCYYEYKIDTPTHAKWFAWNNSAILDADNNLKEIVAVGRDVTERKLYEKEILSKNQFLEGINNATPDTIFIINLLEKRFEYFNHRLTELIGYSKDEIESAANIFEKILYENDKHIFADYLQKVDRVNDNEVITTEVRVVRKDGNIIWLLIREVVFERNKSNDPFKTVGVMTDITNWKMAEESIRESEQRYRSLFEQAVDGILVGSGDGTLLDANSSFTKMSGYTREELVGKNIKSLFKEDTLAKNPIRYDLVRSGHTVTNEREIETKSGIGISVEMNSTQLFDGRLQAFFRDITERKKAEQALIGSERKFRAIFNQTFSFLCILDTEGKIIDINNSILEFLGISKKNIIGKYLWEISLWMQQTKEQNKLKTGVREACLGNFARFETVTSDTKGIFYDIDLTLKPVYDDNEKVVMIISEGRDITNRKNAELALRDREQLLKSIIDQAAVGISRISLDNKWLQVNPMICKITGYTDRELIGKPISEITYREDIELEKNVSEKVNDIQVNQVNYEKRFVHKNGNIVWVKNISSLVLDSHDNPNYIISITEDITEKKQVENQLLQSEHKFRNIFNSSSDAIAIINKKAKLLEVNDILIDILAQEKETIMHSDFFSLIPQQTQKEVKQLFNAVSRKELMNSIEIELNLPENKIIPIELTCKLILYEGEDAVLAMIRDITERKDYEKRVLEVIISTEEREREKFARNLHDDLGPLLSSIKMYMNSFKVGADPDKQKFIIEHVNEIVRESITTTKEISNDLSPHILTNYGLLAAIESFTNKFPDSTINLVSNLKSVRFKSEIEFSLYRILKELINNTNKHAKASSIDIQLMQKRTLIHLIYADNGIGFDMDKVSNTHKSGMGLFNILSRLKSLNGKYKFPLTNQGMKIEITIPFEN